MSTDAKRIAIDWVDEHRQMLVDAHQRIWERPELGLQEHQTSRLLADILEEQGFVEVDEGPDLPVPAAAGRRTASGTPGVNPVRPEGQKRRGEGPRGLWG